MTLEHLLFLNAYCYVDLACVLCILPAHCY